MLKGISPVVSPDMLKALSEMGHGDEVVISDAHYEAFKLGRDGGVKVLRADGVTVTQLLKGIIPLFELDSYELPVAMMAPVPGDTADPRIESEYREALHYDGKIDFLPRFDFYERSKKAYVIIISGDTRSYGNIILKKGVTPCS